MLEYLQLDPSTSFVTINPQTPDAPLGIVEDFRVKTPVWKLLEDMTARMPELYAVLALFKTQLCDTLPARWRDAGITRDFLTGVLEYLLVYGFVPFRIVSYATTARGKRLVPVLVEHDSVEWSADMYHKHTARAFPDISIRDDERRRGGQCYVYFYRPTAARAQLFSPVMAALTAYRKLCELRLYNDVVRARNATRTLVVNRGAAPARPPDAFSEASKPDLFGESIRSSAQKIAVNTTELEIEQDTKQVSFVMRAVKAQVAPGDAADAAERQFEHVLVMPPLCSTEVHQPAVPELDEDRSIEEFQQALALALDLPGGFLQSHRHRGGGSSSADGHVHRERRVRVHDAEQPTHVAGGKMVVIRPDLEECMGIVVALCGQLEYQQRVARGIRERGIRERDGRAHTTRLVAFAVQSVVPMPPPSPLPGQPLLPFQGLLQLYREGLIEHKDFEAYFFEETGMPLAPPQKQRLQGRARSPSVSASASPDRPAKQPARGGTVPSPQTQVR